ncbi:hypothetical protein LR48_Vigan277s000600 [Vigna angularis]|uniref:Uncharacterized protein n=1 Tax=Phaseolus angularis TaxID=3914 RepID=A0A0L9T824_PHAAN|nr:hypothetical protein LR48_Vigan277s000600 [Vigna angularis]
MPTRRCTGGASSSRPRALRPTTIEGWIYDPEKIVEFKGVNVEGMHTQAIQSIGKEILETTLRQMGFVERGNVFLHKDEENQSDEDDGEDAHMAEVVRKAAPSIVGPSSIPASSTF